MKDDYNIINKTMEVLHQINIPLSRTAFIVMIDNGILTQETNFTYYLLALNIYKALQYKEQNELYEKQKFNDILYCGVNKQTADWLSAQIEKTGVKL